MKNEQMDASTATAEDSAKEERSLANAQAALDQSLAVVLANVVALSAKVQGYHWNIEGEDFWYLHSVFERQYQSLHAHVDPLAERIRALRRYAPGSLHDFLALSSLHEERGVLHVPDARTMQKRLLQGYQCLADSVQASLADSQEARDDVTSDMLLDLAKMVAKESWMLRSALAKAPQELAESCCLDKQS